MNMHEFNTLLGYAIAPITLISSIGLLMLCMTARFNHTTSRIRALMHDRESADEKDFKQIDREISVIFKRAALLRKGSLCIALSAVCSGLLVAVCVFQNFTHINFERINTVFLLISVMLIVASTILFSMEIKISHHVLAETVQRLPNMTKKNS